jgi:hypothetical protein
MTIGSMLSRSQKVRLYSAQSCFIRAEQKIFIGPILARIGWQ